MFNLLFSDDEYDYNHITNTPSSSNFVNAANDNSDESDGSEEFAVNFSTYCHGLFGAYVHDNQIAETPSSAGTNDAEIIEKSGAADAMDANDGNTTNYSSDSGINI